MGNQPAKGVGMPGVGDFRLLELEPQPRTRQLAEGLRDSREVWQVAKLRRLHGKHEMFGFPLASLFNHQ